MTHEWPPFGDAPVAIMLMGIAVSTWAQAGGEVGWRGYALPRLAQYAGLGGASLVLGVVWAAGRRARGSRITVRAHTRADAPSATGVTGVTGLQALQLDR